MVSNKSKNKKYSPGFKQFLLRTGIFLIVFIAISYFLGRKAYGNDMLYGFNFWIYGGIGYILLFSILGFILLYRHRLFNLKKQERKKEDWILLVISLVLVFVFYYLEVNLDSIKVNMINALLLHLLLLSMISFLIVGIFGSKFVASFIRSFKKELFYFFIFGLIAYSLMNKVWSLWPYLSSIVSHVVYFLLNLIDPKTIFNAPDVIKFKGFAVRIAEPCSGIYSIFLFTGLYLFISFIDWKKLNKLKVISLFVPALIGAFLVNIFRVFLLMIVGAYLSKEAALGLYHSYTGMIFFMIYFIIFWALAYKWMKK